MSTMKLYILLFSVLVLVGCGGLSPTPAPNQDAGPAETGPDVVGDVAGPEASPDVVEEVVCECAGADFGTYICGGVQQTDAMSCAFCGGHCDSTP